MKVEQISKIDPNESIMEVVFRNREVDFGKVEEFCNPTFMSVQNPFDYINLEKAIDCYINAIENNYKIGFLVDSDCDGYCSASALTQLTLNFFKHTNIEVFMHEDKEHGLTPGVLNKILKSNINLLMIADASSGDYEQHKILKDNGITVVVLDHHITDRYSEDAIVVNNQLQPGANKDLSGMGIVQKFLEGIQLKYGHQVAHSFMDLTAIALVGDCMKMRSLENRYYVTQGLKNINNKLLNELFIGDKDKDYKTISFDIVPTINAFIRIASFEERCDLFFALSGINDTRKIDIRGLGTLELSLQEYIKRMSSRIKSRQSKMINDALMSSELEIFSDGLPFSITILSEDTNKNLTGLIGSRMVESLGKPSIVLKRYGNILRGSARTIDEFKNFKDYISDIGYFNFAQGHQEAFGVGIDEIKLMEMRNNMYNLSSVYKTTKVDKIYENGIYPFDVFSISNLKHQWSRGFEEPLFLTEIDFNNINDFKIVGGKKDTIRFTLNKITYIKFKCDKDEVAYFEKANNENDTIKIVVTFDENIFNGNTYPQIQIKSIV